MCLIIHVGYFSSCDTWHGLDVSVDPDLENRTINGGDVVTYHDVTALTCAQHCAAKFGCGFFTYNAAEKVCALCAPCNDMGLSAVSGYQLFIMSVGW